jgi:hypothetical protein
VAELAEAARETRHQVAEFADSLSSQARSLRDELDALRRRGAATSPSFALARAQAAGHPSGVWQAYRFVSAPWRFVVRKAASTFGPEVLLASVTLAHCIAAGAALVAAPVVYMVQSDFVARAKTARERKFQQERRLVSLVSVGTIPVSFVVATSNSWRCYAADDEHGAVGWAIGMPILHCSAMYAASFVLARRCSTPPPADDGDACDSSGV